jgi:hypothetical protein
MNAVLNNALSQKQIMLLAAIPLLFLSWLKDLK